MEEGSRLRMGLHFEAREIELCEWEERPLDGNTRGRLLTKKLLEGGILPTFDCLRDRESKWGFEMWRYTYLRTLPRF